MSTIWTFDGIENNHDVYTGEYCTKMFCESLRRHVMKIINSEKKKMIQLTNKEYESYLNQTNCHIFEKKFKDKYTNDKKYHKIKDYCHHTGKHVGAVHSICNLQYSISKEIHVLPSMDQIWLSFHHRAASRIAKGEFNCFGGNPEKIQNLFGSNNKS